MSDTVKLIIEIDPRIIYAIQNNKGVTLGNQIDICNAIKNGIPLDDVKAEIEQIYQGIDTISHNEYENAVEQGKESAYENVLEILDNIGKESEVKQEPLDKIKDYVEHIRNTGMGKKKSLEFIEKYIEGLKAESEEI